MKESISDRTSRFNIRESKLNIAAAAAIGGGALVAGNAYAKESMDYIGIGDKNQSAHTLMIESEEVTLVPNLAKDGKAEPPPPTATPTPEPTPSQAQKPESEPLYMHPEPGSGAHSPGVYHPENPLLYENLVEKYFKENTDEALKILACESLGDPNVTGGEGEYGLFQIHPVHNEKFYNAFGNNTDQYDPEQNVAVAHRIFYKKGWGPWTTEEVLYNGGYCPNGMHVSELFSQPMPNR